MGRLEKHLLRKDIGNVCLGYEQLETLFKEVRAVINYTLRLNIDNDINSKVLTGRHDTVDRTINSGAVEPEWILGLVTHEAIQEGIVTLWPGVWHWVRVQRLIGLYRYQYNGYHIRWCDLPAFHKPFPLSSYDWKCVKFKVSQCAKFFKRRALRIPAKAVENLTKSFEHLLEHSEKGQSTKPKRMGSNSTLSSLDLNLNSSERNRSCYSKRQLAKQKVYNSASVTSVPHWMLRNKRPHLRKWNAI